MKKLFAFAATAMLCGTTFAQVPASMPASAPVLSAASMSSSSPSGMGAASEAVAAPQLNSGPITSVNAADKSFVVGTRAKEMTVKCTDTTQFYMAKFDQMPEMTDGKLAEVNFRRQPGGEKTVRALGIFDLKEGEKTPANVMDLAMAIGTLKRIDDKWSLVVKTDQGEQTVEIAGPHRMYTIAKADATALQEGNWVTLQGKQNGENFEATEVHISNPREMAGMGQGQMMTSAPASSPAMMMGSAPVPAPAMGATGMGAASAPASAPAVKM